MIENPVSQRYQSMLSIAAALLFCGLIGAAWLGVSHPVVALVFGMLPFVIYGVFKYPFIMVLGFVLFSFFRIHEAYPQLYSFRIPQLLALASLASLAWHLVITRKMQIYWSNELSWLLGFFALCMLGVLVASNRGVAMAYFNGVFSKIALMTFAIAWLMRRPQDFLQAGFSFVLAGTAVASVALQNSAAGLEMVEGTRVTIGRSFGSTLGDPNDLALVLLFPLGFAVSFLLNRSSRLKQWVGLAATVMLVAAILATQSRGGLLGILTVSAVFAWNRIENKVMLISLAGLAAPILFVVAGVSERASGGAAESGIDESAMGRIYAWEAAIKMAFHHPLTGVGLDNFYANYYFYSAHWDGKNHAVHSTWFGILAETGFLGIAVFSVMLVKVVKTAWNNLADFRAINEPSADVRHMALVAEASLSGLLGTIVSGTFLTQGFTWPFYIFTALIVAISQYAKTQHQTALLQNANKPI
ncbi:O-antigen ligase family protein [Echinimonas agarilytica]|uniref:O-antigen ligase family protein n=1 Tax=Echinimonas agarilytica TaxID=1215918 RepID=A0AA41W5R4_9GAMM|nr:O-antigen ligase family protein [Echinimonas agarilytica]MCM2679534.1 O-antigen ligase family protein [Echinimonas agarilytica]